MNFPEKATIVLVHGAWADGSSWQAVVLSLEERGLDVIAAPIPLTSLSDDAAALKRTLARTQGPVIVAGHAYAGAVIATAHDERVKALVYVAALAPDEGETVAQVFYKDEAHAMAPQLAPDADGFLWMPDEGFANAFAQNASAEQISVVEGSAASNFSQEHSGTCSRSGVEVKTGVVSRRGTGPDDQSEDAALHGGTHAGDRTVFPGGSHSVAHGAGQGCRCHPGGRASDACLRRLLNLQIKSIQRNREEIMKDSVAIVTGASQGIGRSTAIRLARDFSAVVLAARNAKELEEVAAAVNKAGAEALPLALDLSRTEASEIVINATLERFGRIDALLEYRWRRTADRSLRDDG